MASISEGQAPSKRFGYEEHKLEKIEYILLLQISMEY
jgi:hypothetical protein